nr:zinc finger, CCHC-type [Tanacetum cinerariifolium]
VEEALDASLFDMLSILRLLDNLKTFDEAIKSQNDAFWKKAINDEMNSILGNNTWVLPDLPSDVKTTFLNSKYEEDVYVNQPHSFIMLGNENKVDLTKGFLSSKFFMKDMGEDDVIFGIKIKHEMSTPMDTTKKLVPNNGQVVSQLEYSRVIGCMMYAMTCTRPDIAFVIGKLTAGKEAEWLINLILDIPLWSKLITPISILCDSAATLAKAYSQMYNGKSRHLGVRNIMIHELITNKVISIDFVRS